MSPIPRPHKAPAADAAAPTAAQPKCPKGVPPSKLNSCSKFVPLSAEQPTTCGRCGRRPKGL